MTQTGKTQKQRFTCFKNGFCPYCGSNTVELKETKTGYHARCLNPKCGNDGKSGAENSFTNKKVKEWMEE